MQYDDNFTVGGVQNPHIRHCIILVTYNQLIGLRVLE